MKQITQLLQGIPQDDGDASAELLPLVYAELRRLAAHKMAHEAAGHTLHPTALVHAIPSTINGLPVTTIGDWAFF